MSNMDVNITVQQRKSNAPWILGIIAFVMSIPNVLCATLCAATVAAVESETTTATDATDTGISMLIAIVLSSILCFIFSFMGKGKISENF